MASTSNPTKDDISPHYVRITSGGRIKLWVEFSLSFFRENPGRPLVLHTLRSNPPLEIVGSSTGSVFAADSLSHSAEDPDKMNVAKGNGESRDRAISSSVLNIPRLISVVEIIKREYFKELAPGSQSIGLYQYNHLGFIEGCALHPGSQDDEGQRQKRIMMALEGKTHLKQEKMPFMKITLCTSALPALVDSQTTCQLPSAKRPSRAAKARQRRRSLKESMARPGGANA